MYCLRSYIPLLLLPLPLSLSPIHLTLLLLTTYYINRPCLYCSFLLLILFASSCHWSGRCFVDFSTSEGGYGCAEWFTPRIYTVRSKDDLRSRSNITTNGTKVESDGGVMEFLGTAVNQTISTLAVAAFEGAKTKLNHALVLPSPGALPQSAGIGLGWLRSLLGRSEWMVPCLDIKIML